MIKQNKEIIKVLIADDEVEFSSTLQARLTLRNFEATTANSGEATLRAYAQEQPDVLLLDLKMPDLDGLEVLAKLRAEYEDVKVIILTGHGSFELGREGMELGAFDYIMKPVDLTALIEKIVEAHAASGQE